MKMRVDVRKRVASALLAVFTLAGAASVLSACNTFAGMGQDLGAAGNAISNSAEKTKNSL
jgi:predicted small secreted protein